MRSTELLVSGTYKHRYRHLLVDSFDHRRHRTVHNPHQSRQPMLIIKLLLTEDTVCGWQVAVHKNLKLKNLSV